MDAKRILSRLICIMSVCMMISSCEKTARSSSLIGKWEVTDYRPMEGKDGPVVQKNDKTETEFTKWVGGIIEFYPKGEVHFFNVDYSYTVKNGIVTIANKNLPAHLEAAGFHLRIEGDKLFLYDDIAVPGDGVQADTIFMGLIFEKLN